VENYLLKIKTMFAVSNTAGLRLRINNAKKRYKLNKQYVKKFGIYGVCLQVERGGVMNVIRYFEDKTGRLIKMVLEKDGVTIELTKEETISLIREISPS
jgi:hypothetical protein